MREQRDESRSLEALLIRKRTASLKTQSNLVPFCFWAEWTVMKISAILLRYGVSVDTHSTWIYSFEPNRLLDARF